MRYLVPEWYPRICVPWGGGDPRALFGADRDLTWVLAVAIVNRGLSVVIGRHQGYAIDFASGFFLGLSLPVSGLCVALTP